MSEECRRTFWQCGWRPAAGWTCTCALIWGWVLAPAIETVLRVYQIQVQVPRMEAAQAASLITALLGMSAVRTYDKKNNLTK